MAAPSCLSSFCDRCLRNRFEQVACLLCSAPSYFRLQQYRIQTEVFDGRGETLETRADGR